ncbi:helix-turn-helix transcriptional regulator [Sphingobacterium faecium]|jgi:transcriptional regulator with XRE-family HTH domain|uniref:helix-turn-helix domain-containing protein n=1 Tax=Sphingobacterium faecium TaxID=34087 RepID=UPI003209C815
MMEDNLITDEAKRFKAFRQAEKMTQQDMGDLIGKTKSFVNKIEHGHLRLSIDEVKTLHVKKRMSYEWFYHGSGNRIHQAKDENLVKVTTDLKNEIDLLRQKLQQHDESIVKIYRDFYGKK